MTPKALASVAFFIAYIAMAAPLPAYCAPSDNDNAPAALRAKHAELRSAFANNPFQRPLHLDSVEVTQELRGNVYALVDHPFAKLGEALREARNWCEILVLPLHVRRCAAKGANDVALAVVSRPDQAEKESVQLKFAFRVPAATREHLRIEMTAAEGPLGTRDYRIVLDAIPVDAGHTFLRLAYSYGYGSAANLAMRAYLGTSGRDKVGFTLVEDGNGGRRPVGGVRGVLERNVMRYFLAIDAYLDTLAAPPAERLEKRLRAWVAALERYPRQLRETAPDYLALKREQISAVGS